MNREINRTLLLNIPSKDRVIRRYMCSYNAPNFMLPPLELIALGGIIRDWKKDEVYLVDAVAEGKNQMEVEASIMRIKPDLVVSITGFECFEEDINAITSIKNKYPNILTVLFGHYATQFPEEILENAPVDYIILGEPDLIFSELYDSIKNGEDILKIKGIAYKDKRGEIRIQNGNNRIPDPNVLPVPSYELLNINKYYEPFLSRPFAMMQTARGCPFACNYCVHSYGRELTTLTPERVVNDILFLKKQFGIKSIRFIDDTFTANSRRVIRLCELMIENNLDIEWTCLSRTDTIDEEMLICMKKAGCKRIFFGIESASQRVLDYYDKGLKLEGAKEILLLCRKYNIETVGWFIVGMLNETRDDLEKSIEFAIETKLTYVLVNELTPYPGTPLFNKVKDQLDFSLFPYKNHFKDTSIEKRNHKWEKEFYRRFYIRPGYVFQSISRFVLNFSEMVTNITGLLKYLKFATPQLTGRKGYF